MPDMLDNTQPTIVLNPVIQTSGIFPSRDSGGGYLADTLGQIHFLATSYTGNSSYVAELNGELKAIAQNTALFSLLGTNFGGDGKSTFALPDLGGRIVAGIDDTNSPYPGYTFGSDALSLTQDQLTASSGGTANPIDTAQATMEIGWYINVAGVYPSYSGGGAGPATMGMIGLFAGSFAPNNTMPCDGRLLNISEYDALFSIIGTLYGGDGQTTFALPDLRGRVPVGAGTSNGETYTVGETIGSDTVTLGQGNMPGTMGGSGQAIGNVQPGLVLTALIATTGIYGAFDEFDSTLAEVYYFAGNFVPGGYASASGQLLPIAQNQALFSLLGTTYGGNGVTNFALPNLIGRVVAGDDGTHVLGEVSGSESVTVTDTMIPALNITGDAAANTYYGGAQDDTMVGGAGADTLYGNAGKDQLTGGNDDDFLYGGDGDDFLHGTVGNDTLEGGAGDDRMRGGKGSDTLNGGTGADTLYGDNNADTLTGGGGADSFVYTALIQSGFGPNSDTITDFSHAEGDRIDLAAIDAIEATAGDDGFTFVARAKFSHTAGELRFAFNAAGNTVVQIDTDGDGASDMNIVLTGQITLEAGDFVL